MTGLATALTSILTASFIATAGLLSGGADHGTRAALVVDASLARDGRGLIDPRLRSLHAELRFPRTEAEAETDLRYLAARGYRVEVDGPLATAAAKALRR